MTATELQDVGNVIRHERHVLQVFASVVSIDPNHFMILANCSCVKFLLRLENMQLCFRRARPIQYPAKGYEKANEQPTQDENCSKERRAEPPQLRQGLLGYRPASCK